MFFFLFDSTDLELLKRVFEKGKLNLPILWDGKDFSKEIREKQLYYLSIIKELVTDDVYKDVQSICSYVLSAVECYLNGSPSLAYNKIDELVKKYLNFFTIGDCINNDLYRVVKVDDNCDYQRKRVFHTPFSLRNSISTNRYSIAGYPCLYLGSNLKLCNNELRYNPYNNFYIASKFRIISDEIKVKFLDLSIKPQDLFSYNSTEDMSVYTYKNYLYVFPVLMTCSYIRNNKNNPFAPEYIVPQLLLECLKNTISINDYNTIIGIKYFSCYSSKMSNKGYNFVFPSYKRQEGRDYCEILNKVFNLTKPVYINEFESVEECQLYIDKLKPYKHAMEVK